MSQDIVLSTTNLRKHFGSVKAVQDVSLLVQRGEVFGFLGPNGSGKTTTIGMVLGLVHPTAGQVVLFGEPVSPAHNAPLRRVGALVGAPALLPYLSARQHLELVARLHPGVSPQRIAETLELVGLTGTADRRAEVFSSGMKQRLGLAMALVHQPELLILDEPTNGLDPAGMRELRVLLLALSGNGMTIFLSSHLLHEVEQTCDRVAVLRKGRIVATGPVQQLAGSSRGVRVQVEQPDAAARVLHDLAGVSRVELDVRHVEVWGVTSQAVVLALTSNGIIPSEVTSTGSDLESLFLELTKEA